ncbi:MAG: mechanosensitive ion channel family protein [Pseudomonadales bacterium]
MNDAFAGLVPVLVRSTLDRTRNAAAAGVAVLLLACGAPAVAQDAAPAVPSQAVKIVPEASDPKIEERLQRILKSTGWFEGTRVSVHDGVVFLDGTTGTQEHRAWAGALAENTQGTVAVVNRIEADADVGSTFARAGEEFASLYRQMVRVWPLVALAVLIILATWLIARLVALAARFLFASRIESPVLLSVVARAFAIPFFLLGLYFVLQFSGLTRLAFTVLGGTGLIGVIIGFGLRDIAENFLASILLSVRNPFHSGDLIDVGGHTGVVQNLNMRSTVLLTLDGNQVQIPNSTVYKNIIKNYSSIPSRRAEFTVGIGYDSSAAKAQVLIAEVLQEHPAVLETPEPLVLVEELGAATVNLRIYYWFDSVAYSPYKINSALLRQTKNALLTAGIELPDAAREVIFPKGVPVIRMTSPADVALHEAESSAGATRAADEASDTTPSEGDLSSETVEMREQQSEGNLPEAQDNLLKK